MSNLPKSAANAKPAKRSFYQGQEVHNETYGDGYIWLINIRMEGGVEVGVEAVIRFHNDPPNTVRTWRKDSYSPLMLA